MSDWWDRVLGNRPAAGQPDPRLPQAGVARTTYDQSSFTPAPPTPESVNADNLVEAAGSWHGTSAAQAEQPCPQCRTGTLFSCAVSESGMPYRVPPAPRCFHCGFPLVQAGSMSGAAAAAQSTGTKSARQLPRGHVVDSGGVQFPAANSRR